MNRQETALKYFRNEFNCSQSVLTAFGSEYGISENDSLKIACAFGGGMGRQQCTCGAVTGALMVLGLKYGKAVNDPEEKKVLTYSKTKEFFNEFKKLNGSTDCKVLLDGLDLNDPVEHQKIVDLKMFDIKCEKYITDTIIISEELLK